MEDSCDPNGLLSGICLPCKYEDLLGLLRVGLGFRVYRVYSVYRVHRVYSLYRVYKV